MQDSETDRRNMRQILIAAKMQNGKKLTAAELEYLKLCTTPNMAPEILVQRRSAGA